MAPSAAAGHHPLARQRREESRVVEGHSRQKAGLRGGQVVEQGIEDTERVVLHRVLALGPGDQAFEHRRMAAPQGHQIGAPLLLGAKESVERLFEAIDDPGRQVPIDVGEAALGAGDASRRLSPVGEHTTQAVESRSRCRPSQGSDLEGGRAAPDLLPRHGQVDQRMGQE